MTEEIEYNADQAEEGRVLRPRQFATLLYDSLNMIASGMVTDVAALARVVVDSVGKSPLKKLRPGNSDRLRIYHVVAQIKQLEQTPSRGHQLRVMYNTLDLIAKGAAGNPLTAARAAIDAVGGDAFIAAEGAIPVRHLMAQDDEGLFAHANRLAAHLSIKQSALDYLYEISRHRLSSRKDWEKEIRIAFCLERLVPTLPFELLKGFVDQTARDAAVEMLRAPQSTMLMLFHGGLVQATLRLFPSICPVPSRGASYMKDNLLRTVQGEVLASGDPEKALFASLRLLQDGKILQIAPDGPSGKQTASLFVFGKEVTIAEGAIFLAYASKCRTAWYAMRRDDEHFFPFLKFGPIAEKKESFASFKDRLLQFYATQIEDTLTGDPRNVALQGRWFRFCRDGNDPTVAQSDEN